MRRVATLVAVFAITGCSLVSTQTTSVDSVESTSSEDGSTFIPSLAPIVPDARDLRGIAACDLMTLEQKSALGFDLSTESQIRAGEDRGCRWRSVDGDGLLSAVAVQDPPAGLEGLYQVRLAYPIFQPDVIGGQPIVRADGAETNDRDCRIFIGVADDQMIQAAASFAFQPRRGCEVAREMASAMIANLPPRS